MRSLTEIRVEMLSDLVRSGSEFTIIGFQNMTAWILVVEVCRAKKIRTPSTLQMFHERVFYAYLQYCHH
jgi:hypothetical protein